MDELNTKSDLPEYDAVVIGAGPAGTCAALRLLQLGYRVAIVELSDFPRFQIGESLSPGIWNIFQYLEAEHLLSHSRYIRNIPARVIWEHQSEKRMSASQRGPGIIVDRGRMDAELLALCRERGADVFQPAGLKDSRFTKNKWHLEIKTKNLKHRIRAFFVFDARGRNGVQAKNRIQTSPLSVAIWTHLPDRYFPEATLIEALEEGWLWGSPLPNDEFRAMAFVDPDSVKSRPVPELLKSLLDKSLLFNISSRLRLRNYFACPVQSFRNADSWKKNYIHLGESAFTIDPLSSSGVEKAMRFSLQAIIAFNTIMKKGDRKIAKVFYMEKLLNAVASHMRWTREFYSASYIKDSPFWAARRAHFYDPEWRNTTDEKKLTETLKSLDFSRPQAQPADIPISQTLSELNEIPMQISKELKYREMPCVVGDCLELKLAVKHPALSQPTAYIGNIEIAPLIRNLENVFTINSVIGNWTALYSHKTAARLAVYLWSLGIFEKTH